jgi:hypothetical protein
MILRQVAKECQKSLNPISDPEFASVQQGYIARAAPGLDKPKEQDLTTRFSVT